LLIGWAIPQLDVIDPTALILRHTAVEYRGELQRPRETQGAGEHLVVPGVLRIFPVVVHYQHRIHPEPQQAIARVDFGFLAERDGHAVPLTIGQRGWSFVAGAASTELLWVVSAAAARRCGGARFRRDDDLPPRGTNRGRKR